MTYCRAAEIVEGTPTAEPHGSERDARLLPAGGPAPDVVRAGKNTAIYGVHSYSTKVPYQAITPFVEQFTLPWHCSHAP